MDISQLKEICKQVRCDILNTVSTAASGHPGGSLSSVELMVATYFTQMRLDPAQPTELNRDRFVLSKGHITPCYYAVLAAKGFFNRTELSTFRQLGSRLQGHPDSRKTPGVDASTGSLGQGISIAVGMALGAKLAKNGVRVYSLLGDGEMQEGQVWEALCAAAHYKLDNLTVMIDNNGLQIDGTNDEVMSLGDLRGRLSALNLNVIELEDGNDLEQVIEALNQPTLTGKPKCVLAHTVKGKGISFMENQVCWHGKAPNSEECCLALKEVEGIQ